MPRFQKYCLALFLGATITLPAHGGPSIELSPAVNVHCANTIIRAYNTSIEEAKLITDDELEALSTELSEVCQPVQGWTTKDQLYRALAMNGILSERLLRSMKDNTHHMEETTELYGEIKALRSENQTLRDQQKKNATR